MRESQPNRDGDTQPPVLTLLGPRIVPDVFLPGLLGDPSVKDRAELQAADFGFALGHERAKVYLAEDIAHFSGLAEKLDQGRRDLTADLSSDSLYDNWLAAVAGLSDKPAGALPFFVQSDAFQDLRLNSALVGFGQIRHNYVLIGAQASFEGGCVIPSGYVEPAPATYEALIKYAVTGQTVMRELGRWTGTRQATDYFARAERVLRVLKRIGDDELAGQPLSDPERQFLAMVVEMPEIDYNPKVPPKYDGWYYDLFRLGKEEAFDDVDFISDVWTAIIPQKVGYIGAREPRFGFFVVDTGGLPRVVVGPVARGYEYVGSTESRLGDKEAKKLASIREPWAQSYTARPFGAKEPEPPLAVQRIGESTFEVTSTRAIGPVTLSLQEDRRELEVHTRDVSNEPVRFEFSAKPRQGSVIGVRIRVGSFQYWSPVAEKVELGSMRKKSSSK